MGISTEQFTALAASAAKKNEPSVPDLVGHSEDGPLGTAGTLREMAGRADTARDSSWEQRAATLERAASLLESLSLGCEIAYRREPTQAEGDAHEYRGECYVPMGGHGGHRCVCGRWVWGGPTVCHQCLHSNATTPALEWKAEADRLRKLFDDAGQGEHNVLALVEHYQRAAIAAAEHVRRCKEAVQEAEARGREAEREACAVICDAIGRAAQESADRIRGLPSEERVGSNSASTWHQHTAEGKAMAARAAARAIRSRRERAR